MENQHFLATLFPTGFKRVLVIQLFTQSLLNRRASYQPSFKIPSLLSKVPMGTISDGFRCYWTAVLRHRVEAGPCGD